MENPLSRASFLRLAASSLLILPSVAFADDNEISKDDILHDPEAPTAGNPKGDLTIVDFFDYNCPFCKKAAPSLERAVKADGKIRHVYKDWPILGPTSIIGARLALAAKYQGKYLEVHHALMNIPGNGIPQERMIEEVRKTDIDMDRLDADINGHAEEIGKLIRRNNAIAEAIGFMGTPSYLVGPYRVGQALTYEGFVHAVADARAKQKK